MFAPSLIKLRLSFLYALGNVKPKSPRRAPVKWAIVFQNPVRCCNSISGGYPCS